VSGPLNPDPQHTQRGMTLLEVLVVLTIIGLVTAVSAPLLARSLESVRFRVDSDRALKAVQALRVEALVEGRKLSVSGRLPFVDEKAGPSPIRTVDFGLSDQTAGDAETRPRAAGLAGENWPENWAVAGDDIIFLPTGVCLGGTIELRGPNGRSRFAALKAPDCRLLEPDFPS